MQMRYDSFLLNVLLIFVTFFYPLRVFMAY